MKKKVYIIITILFAAAVFGACKKEEEAVNPFAGQENLNNDVSYAMGVQFGAEMFNYLITNGIYPNTDELLSGIADMMRGGNIRIDMNTAYNILNEAFDSMMNERIASAIQKETSYLAENAKRLGVNVTSSGLQYEAVVIGDGPKPTINDTVLVHYEGSFVDGQIFDSTIDYGEPVELPLNAVVPGWSEGLQLMNAGSQYIFYIPYAIAYGEAGYQNPWTGEVLIPGYATLIFIVELIDIIQNTGE